jgi:hypothetical protein
MKLYLFERGVERRVWWRTDIEFGGWGADAAWAVTLLGWEVRGATLIADTAAGRVIL